MATPSKTTILLILDGFGVASVNRGNAIASAHAPTLRMIERCYPWTMLQASGTAVGLPWGEPGNSEVGHLTIGAGRAIYHHLPRIIGSIRDGTFFENVALRNITAHVRANGSSLHLIGLVSSGSVHSYFEHLVALLDLADREQLPSVFIHAITDGKDAPPTEGESFIGRLDRELAERRPAVRIVSLVGRHFAMDRDRQWERIERAYRLFTEGAGTPFTDPAAYLASQYRGATTDEFIEPAYRTDGTGAPLGRIKPGDGVIFFNFREDSMRELASAFARSVFPHFPRTALPNLKFASLTEYDQSLKEIAAAFPPLEIKRPLARVIADAGKRQLHIAETEKYAHVTYFLNGGIEDPFPNEDRSLIPSLAVARSSDEPAMRTPEIVSATAAGIGTYDFIVANFANPDMVGHTGNFEATVRAVEAVDRALAALLPAITDADASLLITGDHGNAEHKIDSLSGEPRTEHTANPVPFYLVGKRYRRAREFTTEEIEEKRKRTEGILIDVAPTVLDVMEISPPPEMTGRSLLPLLLGGSRRA